MYSFFLEMMIKITEEDRCIIFSSKRSKEFKYVSLSDIVVIFVFIF